MSGLAQEVKPSDAGNRRGMWEPKKATTAKVIHTDLFQPYII